MTSHIQPIRFALAGIAVSSLLACAQQPPASAAPGGKAEVPGSGGQTAAVDFERLNSAIEVTCIIDGQGIKYGMNLDLRWGQMEGLITRNTQTGVGEQVGGKMNLSVAGDYGQFLVGASANENSSVEEVRFFISPGPCGNGAHQTQRFVGHLCLPGQRRRRSNARGVLRGSL